jgi:hypothetical protein
MLEPRYGRAAVERFGTERHALLQIPGAAGHDQRRRGVEQSDVAKRARLAVEHALQRGRVGIGVAALQCVAADAGEPCFLRRYLEGADIAVLEARHETRAGEGDLVEPVGAMHHPDGFRAEVLQHLR